MYLHVLWLVFLRVYLFLTPSCVILHVTVFVCSYMLALADKLILSRRFVDPSDPSRLYLAQPSEPTAPERPSAPKYAANYGVDEPYEAM